MIKNVSSTFKANCKKDSVKYREYIVIDNKEVDIYKSKPDPEYYATIDDSFSISDLIDMLSNMITQTKILEENSTIE